ncbi:unnamed protein product [Trichogramma brassicae]|uniref:Uncharacterized protein n=1 Tax=Trichogramma brassicae TaxID=86971 RepID=A0A6H5I139_9HYME|nr:unnamed protein product [Trichogramma brassicae]
MFFNRKLTENDHQVIRIKSNNTDPTMMTLTSGNNSFLMKTPNGYKIIFTTNDNISSIRAATLPSCCTQAAAARAREKTAECRRRGWRNTAREAAEEHLRSCFTIQT